MNRPTPPRNSAGRPSGGNGRTVTRTGRLRPVSSFSRARIDGTSSVPARRGTTRNRLTKTFDSPTTAPIPLTLIGLSSLPDQPDVGPRDRGRIDLGPLPRADHPHPQLEALPDVMDAAGHLDLDPQPVGAGPLSGRRRAEHDRSHRQEEPDPPSFDRRARIRRNQ